MDVQLKRGLLEMCVLKVVSQEATYGYKIIGDISKHIEVSESTLYPILKRLEASDCLSTYTKEYNSRLRKYYKITEIGLQRILYFKTEWQQVKKLYEFIVSDNVASNDIISKEDESC